MGNFTQEMGKWKYGKFSNISISHFEENQVAALVDIGRIKSFTSHIISRAKVELVTLFIANDYQVSVTLGLSPGPISIH